MRIFVSAGEPSGDLHGANLIHALRRHHPALDCVGFGGARMAAAGCDQLYPLCDLAVMGVSQVLAHAPVFLEQLSHADRYFRHHRPDAVVMIDYPGFHWWLARRARFHRIPVFWFVPPQLWGWASWRVNKMRRTVDHVLCSLPFEEEWYRQRDVTAHYVGHPYFDEMPHQRLDAAFVAAQRAHAGPVVALLPGSRNQEIERNLPTLVRAAEAVHAARPDVRFLAACYKEKQRRHVAQYVGDRPLPMEVHAGRTPEIIHLAQACAAVSGSVSLELLWHGTPTVIVYRVKPLLLRMRPWLLKCRFITLVNLLADRELFPEFVTDRCPAAGVSQQLLHWLNDPESRAATRQELVELRQQVAAPGACERAARFILTALAKQAAA